MAIDRAVDSARLNDDLEAVADAIRAKGGTSAQLAFPSDFVSAISAIAASQGYEVLASGDYVLSANSSATELVIPVSVTGKAAVYYVEKASVSSGVGQSHTWLRVSNFALPTEAQAAFSPTALLKVYASNGTAAYYGVFSSSGQYLSMVDNLTNPTKITIRRYSTTFQFKADTHHWYVWGETS